MNTVSQATDIKRGPLQRSKLEYFGTIDNGFQLLTIVVELSILWNRVVLTPSLQIGS